MRFRHHHTYLIGLAIALGLCSLIFASAQSSGKDEAIHKLSYEAALPWPMQPEISTPKALQLQAKIASVQPSFGAFSASIASVPQGTLAAKLLISKPVHIQPNPRAKIKRTISDRGLIGGGEVILPVLASVTRGGRVWLRVPIDHRPNGNSGWITNDGTLPVRIHTKIVVSLSQKQLTLYRNGVAVLRLRAGIGAPGTPTPRGSFPVVEILRQPQGSAIGPWAIALAGFSQVLTDFDGGPGQIAIHGTSDPSSIGRAASHGCVHVSNSEDIYLAHTVELGTRVLIKR